MTFYKFIQRYAGTQTAFGDFVEDVVYDPNFPRKAKNYETLLAYFEANQSSELFIQTFERVFEHYRKLEPYKDGEEYICGSGRTNGAS